MPVILDFYLIIFFAFCVGASLGSFVTMASYRLPLSQDIVVKPSYCPSCDTKLGIPDLVPLFSWARQRGRCRHCQKPIGVRYPLTELAMALVTVALTLRTGLTLDTLILVSLATMLAILIVTDLEHFIIPDGVQLAVAGLGILYDVHHDADPLAVLGSVTFGLSLGLILHYGYLWFRHKDALGWGDVKFLAVAGLWLPFADFIPFLFLSGVLGVITGLGWRKLHGGAIFPFGPALALAMFLVILYPGLLGVVP